MLGAPGLPLTLLHQVSRTNSFFVFMELSPIQPTARPYFGKNSTHFSREQEVVTGIQCSHAGSSPPPKVDWGAPCPTRNQFLFLILFSLVNQQKDNHSTFGKVAIHLNMFVDRNVKSKTLNFQKKAENLDDFESSRFCEVRGIFLLFYFGFLRLRLSMVI